MRLVPTYLADAEAIGDLYSLHGLRSGRGNPYWLVIDRPADARAMASGAAALTRGEFLLYDYFQVLAAAQCALYVGDGEDALACLDAARARFERSLVRRIQIVRIEWIHLTARANLAAAAKRTGRERDRAIAAARTAVKQLAAEKAPWTAALEALCRAALFHLTGDAASTVAALDRAVETATAADMSLHATVARYHRGDPDAGTAMARRAIANPPAMVRLIAPGW